MMNEMRSKIPSVVSIAILLLMLSCASTNNIFTCADAFEGRGEVIMSADVEVEGIVLSVETADPVALRAFLMQGLSLTIPNLDMLDSTRITFPSARDVSPKITRHPGEVKATLKDNKEKRPDIRPLLVALNDTTTCIEVRNQRNYVHDYQIEVEPNTGTIRYSVTLPAKKFHTIDEVLLTSKPDNQLVNQGEMFSREIRRPMQEPQKAPFGSENSMGESSTHRYIEIHFNLRGAGNL